MNAKLTLVAMVGVLVTGPGVAGAEEAEATATEEGQHLLGLSVVAGPYTGIGAGVQLGLGPVGVHVTGGWQPLFVATEGDETPTFSETFHFHSTAIVGADAYALLYRASERGQLGLTAGYKYSTHLGHGASAGAYVEIDAESRFPIFIMAGVTWFPRGDERLREKAMTEYPDGTDFTFPGPSVLYGASAGVSWYP